MSCELQRASLPERSEPRPPPAEPTQRELAVLIVAYRNPVMLGECLASVRLHLGGHKVLVWDNSGPRFPGMQDVAVEYPSVSWLGGSSNIGFAAAVNALAAMVPEDDLLLINPDAVLQGPLIGTRAAIRRFGVAAAAPLVHDASARPAHRPWDVAHREQSLSRALVAWTGYAARARGLPWSDLYDQKPKRVSGYLTGACLGISRDAWESVGFFDEEFFLYGEEADWQRRATSAGWSLELIDEIGVSHTGHGTVANDSRGALRSKDLLRANIALNLELEKGGRRADLFLAGSSVLDRIQRSGRQKRAQRRRQVTPRPPVVITTNSLMFGGAERQRALLAGELVRRGHEVVIVCLQRLGPLIAEIDPAVRVVRQPWWAPLVDLQERDAVVISGETNTETGFATLWRASRRGRRWLVALHMPPESEGPTFSGPLAAAIRRSDGVVALSPRHWKELTAHQSIGRRSFIAPNAFAHEADLDHVPPRSPVSAVPHLVMLTRIVEQTNPHLLVQALDGLRGLPWRLSIFGDGPDRMRLEALTSPHLKGRVVWRGWSPGPDDALADCDLLCVPSRCEAFPSVILEAMARRIPVAASSLCAVDDMLDGGQAGILVEDISVTGWRSALDKALRNTDRWPELGERGFQRLHDRYTIEAMTDSYESAIDEVLS